MTKPKEPESEAIGKLEIDWSKPSPYGKEYRESECPFCNKTVLVFATQFQPGTSTVLICPHCAHKLGFTRPEVTG